MLEPKILNLFWNCPLIGYTYSNTKYNYLYMLEYVFDFSYLTIGYLESKISLRLIATIWVWLTIDDGGEHFSW